MIKNQIFSLKNFFQIRLSELRDVYFLPTIEKNYVTLQN
jgi:hypothetical protein